jgi:kynurenine 3-monooxygenase
MGERRQAMSNVPEPQAIRPSDHPLKEEEFHVVVVGAGLAGCLCALLLSRLETSPPIKVTVLESRQDPRCKVEPTDGSRSINLALSVRGISALKVAGIDEAVSKVAVPMHGRCVHDPKGHISTRPYGKKGQFLLSVSRAKLNTLLLEACAARQNIRLIFNAKCSAVDLDRPAVVYSALDFDSVEVPCDLVVGADGSYSRVRAEMERCLPRFDSSREHIAAVYKELSIPASVVKAAAAAAVSKHACCSRKSGRGSAPSSNEDRIMPREYLHVWPRHEFMLIALPNQDGSFTATLFMDAARVEALEVAGREEVTTFFDAEFPDAVPLLPDLADQFLTAPSAPLLTVRCRPYNYKDRAILIGDAAHAIVPFYGQGCNAAFEDCTLLVKALQEHGVANLSVALQDYAVRRKPDADAIADLAIEHYCDMASKSASLSFAFRRRFGIMLHSFLPRLFVPLYSMITFSTMPYAQAVKRKQKQDRLLAVGIGLVIAGIVCARTICSGRRLHDAPEDNTTT